MYLDECSQTLGPNCILITAKVPQPSLSILFCGHYIAACPGLPDVPSGDPDCRYIMQELRVCCFTPKLLSYFFNYNLSINVCTSYGTGRSLPVVFCVRNQNNRRWEPAHTQTPRYWVRNMTKGTGGVLQLTGVVSMTHSRPNGETEPGGWSWPHSGLL